MAFILSSSPKTGASYVPSRWRLPFAFPPRGAVLFLFCALFILPGLIGHDPWKSDDATHFGLIYSLLVNSDLHHWLIPHLAGEVWLDNPPLYYWVAALFGKIFGFILPLHDAARLASGLFAALMLGFLASTARRLSNFDAGHTLTSATPPNSASPAAILVAIACVGWVVHLHEMQPATAFLAATAATYYGLALLPLYPLRGGLIAGTATGLGFAAIGLPALLLLVPLPLLLLIVSPKFRTLTSLGGILVLLIVGSLVSAAWPLALAWFEPLLFDTWWARELADLHIVLNWPAALWGYIKLLSWFAWPALPLSLWALWRGRRHLVEPVIALPLTSFLLTLAVQSAFFEPRSLNALPLLPPLILLAVPATSSLRRGARNAMDWFGMMTFTLLAGLIWLCWVAMFFGIPTKLANNIARIEPGFIAQFSIPALAAALALTLGWLWLVFGSPRSPLRGAVHWAGGMILAWGLVISLLMPWVDYGKSYRAVVASLMAAIPVPIPARIPTSPAPTNTATNFPANAAATPCILGRDLGEPQRASLHYFAGIITQRDVIQDSKSNNKNGNKTSAQCKLLLVQSTVRDDTAPGKGWRKIWEGNRRGDRTERFRLYQRK